MRCDDAEHSSPRTPKDSRVVIKYFLYAVLGIAIAYVFYDLIQQDYSSRYAFGFTAVGIWAFGLTALLVVHLCRPSIRHRKKQAAIALFVYVGTYVYFTSAGQYDFSQSGKVRYSFGISASDVSIWQPRFLDWQTFQNVHGQSTSRGSTLGYYYAPLIFIDRLWFHPTRTVIAEKMPRDTDAK
ncbi:MAG: hypothetical protein JNL58_21245 [Planctomyces sp.]|nr:hypothetical protein [Planctomyces sp.]